MISTNLNVNTARRPRKLPAAVLSRAQAKARTRQGSHRGHASPRRRCPDSRSGPAARMMTEASC